MLIDNLQLFVASLRREMILVGRPGCVSHGGCFVDRLIEKTPDGEVQVLSVAGLERVPVDPMVNQLIHRSEPAADDGCPARKGLGNRAAECFKPQRRHQNETGLAELFKDLLRVELAGE